MPHTFDIPSRRETHCEPCEHLRRTNMLCSRLNGISCDYVCKHPKALDSLPLPEDATKAAKALEMRARIMDDHGRAIGKKDLQPDWCPLKAA